MDPKSASLPPAELSGGCMFQYNNGIVWFESSDLASKKYPKLVDKLWGSESKPPVDEMHQFLYGGLFSADSITIKAQIACDVFEYHDNIPAEILNNSNLLDLRGKVFTPNGAALPSAAKINSSTPVEILQSSSLPSKEELEAAEKQRYQSIQEARARKIALQLGLG